MAAGQGFKTFTTGEVLTAADVNGYLMQGINVFASSAARSAAITSPQEGQYSFLKDTNALEYYDGAAWVGAPVGDITAVTAGKGLTGGGSSGDVTVALATTAKGDLVAGSGASTAAVLSVGADGDTIVADSSTATGLRYQPSISQNFVINGNFDIWQRGTSFVSPSGYTADRWTSGGGLNATVAQETTTIQDGSTYSLKITSTGAGSYQQLITYLESGMVNALAGKTIVLSAYVRANATFSGTLELKMSTGTLADTTGGTWTAASSQTVTPTTSGWTRVQTSYAVPSGTKGLRFELNYVTGQANGSIVYWSQVQAEIGSVPTVFKRSGGTIQGELAAASRYYQKSYNASVAPATNTNVGITQQFWATSIANNAPYGNITLPVKMRTAPTVTIYSEAGTAAAASKISDGLDLGSNSAVASILGEQTFTVRNQNASTQTTTQGTSFHYVASAEL